LLAQAHVVPLKTQLLHSAYASTSNPLGIWSIGKSRLWLALFTFGGCFSGENGRCSQTDFAANRISQYLQVLFLKYTSARFSICPFNRYFFAVMSGALWSY